jgi:hypothetical protein
MTFQAIRYSFLKQINLWYPELNTCIRVCKYITPLSTRDLRSNASLFLLQREHPDKLHYQMFSKIPLWLALIHFRHTPLWYLLCLCNVLRWIRCLWCYSECISTPGRLEKYAWPRQISRSLDCTDNKGTRVSSEISHTRTDLTV